MEVEEKRELGGKGRIKRRQRKLKGGTLVMKLQYLVVYIAVGLKRKKE